MQQLIEIKTVPISIEYRVTDCEYKPAKSTVEVEMSTEKGGLHMKSRPIKLNIDTFEARRSVNPTVKDCMTNYANKGKQAAYEATARYAEEGQIYMDVKFTDEALRQISELRLGNNQHQTPNIRWIPDHPADISWEPGDLSIRYEMDKLNFDFKQNKQPLEFTPGNIELVVTQWPDVIINYIGGPLYVPPSADPSYVGPEEE